VSTKRALTIGINYTGSSAELFGCHNDALDWADALEARGYSAVRLLGENATRSRILQQLRDAVEATLSGDRLIVTNSSHGTYVPDTDGDEPDGVDEAICPADFMAAGVITDDELFDIFNDRHRGAKILLISDSCFSGSIGRFAPPIMGTPKYTPRPRFLPPRMFLGKDVPALPTATKSLVSSIPTLSGCTDRQVSYDAWFETGWSEPRANGAFTRVALDALNRLYNPSTDAPDLQIREWHREIRKSLPSQQYFQTPLVAGTSSQRAWQMFA
jgi:hypothetical protein